jgi:hypothetical protein
MPKLIANLDFQKRQALNIVVHNLGSAPGTPVVGQMYYDTGSNNLFFWNGTSWSSASGGYGAENAQDDVGTILVDTNSIDLTYDDGTPSITAALRRKVASLTSSQGTLGEDTNGVFVTLGLTANTAMSGDTRLDQIAAPTADVSLNSRKITNLATPTASTDAATKGYVDSAIQGLDPKQSVVAATTANITLSGAQTIDGVSCIAGDRVLVKNQGTASQNGIYIVAAGSWTRALDMDAWSEVPGSFVAVEQGTANGDKLFLCTSNAGGTIDSTAIDWSPFPSGVTYTGGDGIDITGTVISVKTSTASTGINGSSQVIVRSTATSGQVLRSTGSAGAEATWGQLDLANANAVSGTLPVGNGGTGGATTGAAKTSLGFMTRFAQDIGDNSSTTITVTHNLGTRDVQVAIYTATGTYEEVWCDIEHATTNTTVFKFDVAPTTNQYRVVIIG